MSRPMRDPRRRPTHPGAILRLDVLPDLNITQEEFARRLGVSRVTVSQLLNEHRALTAAMAVRLERELGVRAEQWLAMQQAVDLWDARSEAALESAIAGLAPVFTSSQHEAKAAIARARDSARAHYTSGQTIPAPADGIGQVTRTEGHAL